MAYVELIAGLVILVLAGDFLVRGAVSMAKRLGVPTLLIGLTIVAFGTSAPELVVGVDAVLSGAPALAVGNVAGSNIANILLVIGAPALIHPILCHGPKLGRNMTFMLAISFLVWGLSFSGGITYYHGLGMVALLIGFLLYSAKQPRGPKEIIAGDHALHDMDAIGTADLDSHSNTSGSPQLEDPTEEMEELKEAPLAWPKTIILIILGLVGLVAGAELLVSGAVTIARELGVSEAVIGLTLVAIGTSLPELVTALAAAVRGHSDVAVGNVIGSNIFNILGILGISSLFGTLPVSDDFLYFDFPVMIASSLLIVPLYLMKKPAGKLYGLMMLTLYVGYMAFLAMHGT